MREDEREIRRQRLLEIVRAIDEDENLERYEQFLDQMKERQQRGWKVARTGAWILKQEFGASKVVLFGSLLDPTKVTPHSDIDLAVWGLPEKDFFKAGAVLDDVSSYYGGEFEVDLVEIQHAKPHILKAIESEGRELEAREDEKKTLSQIREGNRQEILRMLAESSKPELDEERAFPRTGL